MTQWVDGGGGKYLLIWVIIAQSLFNIIIELVSKRQFHASLSGKIDSYARKAKEQMWY